MLHEIVINNRQRARKIDRRKIKKLIDWLLIELKINEAQLGVHLVTPAEMARVHETYMGIPGSTDVITFDHGSRPPTAIHGEIFISPADAVLQSKQYRTQWRSEIHRYLIHGILHLLGYDDTTPTARQKMKREENRLLKLDLKG